MKKVKMIFIAAASIIGIAGAFGFSKPAFLNCGWIGSTQYVKGTGPGQYTCTGPDNVTCTFTTMNGSVRCDTGDFTLH